MMRTTVLVAAMALWGSMALSAQKVQIYQAEGLALTHYMTYSWLPGRALSTAGIVDAPPMSATVQRAIDAQLAARGLRRVEAAGELEVSFLAFQGAGTQVLSLGRFENTMWSVGNMPVDGRSFKTGTLAVNAADPKMAKSVLLVVCSDTLNKPSEVDKKIDRAVLKAFKKVPGAVGSK
jgi:hypothetical protein